MIMNKKNTQISFIFPFLKNFHVKCFHKFLTKGSSQEDHAK